MLNSKIPKNMIEYGVCWCETGLTKSGKKTTICGKCIYASPEECDAIADEIESNN